jgi:hypothetical protein
MFPLSRMGQWELGMRKNGRPTLETVCVQVQSLLARKSLNDLALVNYDPGN